MTKVLNRRNFLALSGVGALSCLPLLSACSSNTSSGGASSANSSDASGSADVDATHSIKVGTLPTEDLLPYWVAAEEGLFDAHGLNVEVVHFQAATELIAGVSSGEVDLAMTDIMVTASMAASGTDVSMKWITLGTTPDQGRFGIMAGPNSGVKSIDKLAGVPIGVGSNTILEYVMDKLMEAAGIPEDQIVVEELQKLPVRFQAMIANEVQAAALPGSLLALGEAQGCTLIVDDTQGENLSQSVMIVQNSLLESEGGEGLLQELQAVWDEAVDLVNANPENYRGVLIANANLSDEIADSYPICQYPAAQMPTAEMVDPVLAWMEKKGYLSQQLSYDASTGGFTRR